MENETNKQDIIETAQAISNITLEMFEKLIKLSGYDMAEKVTMCYLDALSRIHGSHSQDNEDK